MVASVYFLKRFLKGKKYGSMQYSEHLSVLDEGITLSFGQKLSIVKAGEELFLVTYGQNGVAFQKMDDKFVQKEASWNAKMNQDNHSDSFNELGEMLKGAK